MDTIANVNENVAGKYADRTYLHQPMLKSDALSFSNSPARKQLTPNRNGDGSCVSNLTGSTVLDDAENRHLLEVIMMKQKLQEGVYRYQKLREELKANIFAQRLSRANQSNLGEAEDFTKSLSLVDAGEERNFDLTQDFVDEILDEDLEFGNLDAEIVVSLNRTLSERMIQWITENHEEVVDRIVTGSEVTKDFATGSLTGYLAALLVKKFGKVVLCSLAGGVIFTKIAHSKGIIKIDWNQIYGRLEEQSLGSSYRDVDPDDAAAPLTNEEDDDRTFVEDWLTNKLCSLGNWAKDNTCLATGFIAGFLYKSFS